MRLKLLFIYTAISRLKFVGFYSSSTVCMTAFFLGACLTLGLHQLPQVAYLLVLCLALLFLSFYKSVLRVLAFSLIGFVWACYSFQTFLDVPFPSTYESVEFIALGNVEGLPTSRSGNIQFRFKVDSVENSDLSMLHGKRLQISCYRCPMSIRAGEQWRMTLRVKRPHGYASWGAFDYEKYLFRHKVIAKGYVRLKGENQRISINKNSLSRWRQRLFERLQNTISKENANDGLSHDGVGGNIISALTIGVKTGFSNKQQQVFQTTGVSHLMAISGLHVGLVFIGASTLLKWLMWPIAGIFEYCPRQKIVLLPALLAALFYAALAGFSVSTQRALIMLLVYVVCKFLARDASLIKVLLIAITVLLLVDPFSILDVGFWLSCGAVAVIGLVSLKNVSLKNVPLKKPPVEMLSKNELSANKSSVNKERLSLVRLQPLLWLGMLPMSVVFFGQVSLISPLINLVAVPLFCIVLIPATLISMMMFALGLKALSVWCLIQLAHFYELIYQALEFVSQLGFAKIYTTPLAWWQWLIFGLLLGSYLMPIRVRMPLSLLLIASVFTSTSKSLDDDELQITLLDVGQGLAMVIETPSSVTVYDTGPRYGTGFTAAEAVLLPFLRQRGISRIDTLIISHADNDHIGGLEMLREAFQITRTITSRLDKVSDATACLKGQAWMYDQTKFSVISPQIDTPEGSNNLSCVIMLEHHGIKVLITGDIEKQVERFLVAKSARALKADILLVPHQGSKTSSTNRFLDAVSPSMAMLAAGYKNHYGHPHASVVERYQARSVELLSTIKNGSILLKVNSRGWSKVLYRQHYGRFWYY